MEMPPPNSLAVLLEILLSINFVKGTGVSVSVLSLIEIPAPFSALLFVITEFSMMGR